jgi:uncharacterized membrane protein
LPLRRMLATLAHMRVRVVDLLRLVAAFQMVQGHTLDAVLAEHLRAGAWFDAWSWARGLTSVAFLFVTGLTFHLATVSALDRHLRDPAAIKRRFRRGGLLIGIGYVLHAPIFALGSGLDAALHVATVVDVLQTIGVCLCLLEGTLLVLRSGRAAALCWAALACAVLAASPFAAQVVPEGPLRPLLQFVSPLGGSIFPLLPWAAHVLLGAALAPLLLAGDARQRTLRFALGALAFLVFAALVRSGGWTLASVHLDRLGAVLVVGTVLAALEPLAGQLPSWAWRLSGETLFIYVVHILIAYGSGPSLRTLVGPTLSLAPALGVALLVLVFTAVSALAYPRLLRGLARGAEAG